MWREVYRDSRSGSLVQKSSEHNEEGMDNKAFEDVDLEGADKAVEAGESSTPKAVEAAQALSTTGTADNHVTEAQISEVVHDGPYAGIYYVNWFC